MLNCKLSRTDCSWRSQTKPGGCPNARQQTHQPAGCAPGTDCWTSDKKQCMLFFTLHLWKVRKIKLIYCVRSRKLCWQKWPGVGETGTFGSGKCHSWSGSSLHRLTCEQPSRGALPPLQHFPSKFKVFLFKDPASQDPQGTDCAVGLKPSWIHESRLENLDSVVKWKKKNAILLQLEKQMSFKNAI